MFLKYCCFFGQSLTPRVIFTTFLAITFLTLWQVRNFDQTLDTSRMVMRNARLRQLHGDEFIENYIQDSKPEIVDLDGYLYSINIGFKYPVYVRTAFYDERYLEGRGRSNSTFVRLFATMDAKELKKGNITSTLCSLVCMEGEKSRQLHNSTISKVENSKWMYWVRRRKQAAVLFSCQVPFGSQCHEHENCRLKIGNSNQTIPIAFQTFSQSFEHKFGMCLAGGPLYGTMTSQDDADWLIEWFEINRIFGVTEFNFPNATLQVSPQIQQILDYYQIIGVLNITQVFNPDHIFFANNFRVENFRHVLLNECLYMNMYRYQYVLVIDIDEIIVPKFTSNYSKALNTTGGRYIHNIFSRAFFRTNKPSKETKSTLVTSRYILGSSDARKKTILNPRACVIMNSHECRTPLRPTANSDFDENFEVHHYRKKCFKTERPKLFNKKKCAKLYEKSTPNRFLSRLEKNVTQRFDRIKNILA